jgi:hypothetical protein
MTLSLEASFNLVVRQFSLALDNIDYMGARTLSAFWAAYTPASFLGDG